ncbi:MAG: hypothetical protein KF725_12890 [Cyclobacteriaceae bacterium]|nr:hypothetical protein [Cyclobacteriaceae bacterium]UYN85475.1 MAG: hypothetical protein KIT51_11325 [Cyclobacteriaceae bacterium]
MKMKYRTFRLIDVPLLSVCALLIICCQDDNIFIREAPSILPRAVPETFIQEQNLEVTFNLELRAISGLSDLVVKKDGEVYDTRTFNDDLLFIYSFSYVVEGDLVDGTILRFTFELTDKAGKEAVPFSVNVKVGPPFEITDDIVFDTPVKRVKGRINRDVTFTADNIYWLDSIVSVEGNRTLTIEAGSTVLMRTFSNTIDSRLAITQGSKIIANGTKDLPIVFTSDRILNGTANTADWGGIYLYGRAPTNQASTVFEDGFRYGGSQLNDNSGSLQFVRIEYGGKNGVDGITILGVGDATILDYIQIYRCFDQAFRLKGGRVNVKHIVCTGHAGYGLWAEHGWIGKGQFLIFETDVPATIFPVNFQNQARSLELRNDASNFNLQPATYVRLANITMIGNGNAIENGTRRGLRVRRGAMGLIHNVICTNFPDDGVRVEDVTLANLTNGTMVLGNTRSFFNREDYDEQAEDFFLVRPEFNVTIDPVPGITLGNFVGSVPTSFDPRFATGFDSWFESAPFIGAVRDAANDWTADGVWCKNLDGTIR